MRFAFGTQPDNRALFGILSGQIEQPDLIYQHMMQDELVLIVPAGHPFALQEVITPDMLRGKAILRRLGIRAALKT